jgi:DNA repair protein RadA
VQNITQLEDERITHSRDAPRDNRQYISADNIKSLAKTKFKQSLEGLTYEDLVNDGPFKCADSEQRARDTLYYHYGEGHLFTFGRPIPQQYFATQDDAEKAAIYREKNTHSHPTGVRSSSSPNGHSSSSNPGAPLANALEYCKAQDFYHALIMLKVAPLAIHNIRLYLKLTDPKRYDIIPPHYEEENKAKVLRRRKGDVQTTYKVYPHGAVDISIECSKTAFPIETDLDIMELFSFVGGVCNTLQDWLQDVNAYIVPPVTQWRLLHADVCKDVRVPERLHLTVPNMELRTVDRVLRMYVKPLGNESVLRLEEMMMYNKPFSEAVDSLRNGASSSSTAAIFTHSLHPAAFIEIAELKRQNAMLMSRVVELEERIVENRKLPAQEIRLKEETTSSEQIDVYDKEKEEVDNTGKSDSSSNDGYKQTPLNSRHSITETNSAKVENKKVEIIKLQQQEQQLITIAPSTTPDCVPLMASAADLLEQRKISNNYLRNSTGSRKLDDLLGGGIERGAVTEIVGPSGTGKTELCFILSVNAHQLKHQQERISDDALKTRASGARVLFIDTSQLFDRSRIYSIAQARGLDPDAAMKSIAVERIHDFQAVEELIEDKLDEFLKKNPDMVLVIVDSIAALQPEQHMKKEEEYLSSWQQRLDSLMYSLKRVALENHIAVVVTNRRDEPASSCHFGQMQVLTTARNMILNAITYRLSFKNHEGNRVARIVHSPYHPEEEVPFTFEHEGITDIHQ